MKRLLVGLIVLSSVSLVACKDAPPPLPMTAEGMEHTASAPATPASTSAPAAAPASAQTAAPASAPAAPAPAPASTSTPASK